MEILFNYLWKFASIIIIFYGFYRFFLSKETYFGTIRGFLIAGIAVAVTLPFMIVPIYVDSTSVQFTELATNSIIQTTEIIPQSYLNLPLLLFYTYLIVTTILLLRFIFQLISIGKLILNNIKVKTGKFYIVETNKEMSPFSFFNFIIYNPRQFNEHELKQIIAHEKVHALQMHSIDTLLSNLLTVVQWYNPFAWFYKKEIEQNLEFIADKYAQEVSHSQICYQKLLLKTSIPQYQMALANNFYNSRLKKRIIMLHKKRSNSKSQWKIAIIAPLLLAFVFTFNTKTIAQKKNVKKEFIKMNVEIFKLRISKESSEDDLKEVTNTFSDKGLNLKFNGVKRNNNDEITAIKIDAKAKSGKASASYATNNDEGINPIQISFDNENNNLSIGSGEAGQMKRYTFSHKGEAKKMKHRVHKKGDNTFIYSDDEDHLTTKIWVNKDGDTTKVIRKKMVIEMDDDHDGDSEHEIHLEMDDDGKEVRTEVIKIRTKKGDGNGNLVFISEDDDDDKNTTTTYIVNGKKMSKEEFKKFDKDKIKTIEIKKEVKKEE